MAGAFIHWREHFYNGDRLLFRSSANLDLMQTPGNFQSHQALDRSRGDGRSARVCCRRRWLALPYPYIRSYPIGLPDLYDFIGDLDVQESVPL